jgi:RNA polymerase sigma factor (TIGR02999 family)
MQASLSSLLASAENGDGAAARELFTALYGELHRLARRELARGGGRVGLGTTSLLHEAYLDLAKREDVSFPDRARFMAYAARAMRGLVIDFVRARRAVKRGGELTFVSLTDEAEEPWAETQELEKISDGLDALAALDPALAEVVDLRFFCGLTLAEIATLRSVSERTVQRQWEKARIYLHGYLHNQPQSAVTDALSP